MIKHVVLFKFKSEAASHKIKEALDSLRALPQKVSVIRSYEVGENIVKSPRAWDVVLIGEYDDLAALDVYAKHEDHVAAVKLMSEVCEAVGAVDYQV